MTSIKFTKKAPVTILHLAPTTKGPEPQTEADTEVDPTPQGPQSRPQGAQSRPQPRPAPKLLAMPPPPQQQQQQQIQNVRSMEEPRNVEQENILKCNDCSFVASAPWILQNHIKGVHDKIKDRKCDQCSFKTSYISTLHRHKMMNHGIEGAPEKGKDSPQRREQPTWDARLRQTITVQTAADTEMDTRPPPPPAPSSRPAPKLLALPPPPPAPAPPPRPAPKLFAYLPTLLPPLPQGPPGLRRTIPVQGKCGH